MKPEQYEKFMHAFFLHATESIIVCSEEGLIKLINPAAERIFGYAFGELKDQSLEVLIPERFADKHLSHRHHYMEAPRTRSMGIGMDLYAKKKDGSEFPVEISLSPFESGTSRFVIAFVIDISKRKDIEEEVKQNQKRMEQLATELKVTNERLESKVKDRTKVLQEALQEIERSRKDLSEALKKEKDLNELKSRFLTMASHEFRTPLASILSSADLILDYQLTGDQESRARHVDRIKSSVNNMNGILGDFLSLSKIEEGRIEAEPRKFNLAKIMTGICAEMKGITKRGQVILYDHEGDDEVEMDDKILRNVVINLLTNAVKFSDEGSSIYIKTKQRGGSVSLEVRDEGIGISEEDKKNLFERFFRGRNVSTIPGTGLGLNIVAKYLELMEGKIELKSELNKGTTFTLEFPNNHKRSAYEKHSPD